MQFCTIVHCSHTNYTNVSRIPDVLTYFVLANLSGTITCIEGRSFNWPRSNESQSIKVPAFKEASLP
eukprot:scaffold133790_cov23-Cyclotella_meneghiniana.AAC.1